MYVRNESGTNQQFRAGKTKFMMRPGATAPMTDEEFGDHVVQILLRKGTLVEVGDDEGADAIVAQEEAKKAKAEERKLEVSMASDDTTKRVIMVQCAATKKNGERCQGNVSVKLSEYDEEKPYFCGPHRNESADDYEKVEGVWKKKVVVDEQPAEDAAEPAEESLDDPITPEVVAELVAEVEAEEGLE